MNDVITENTFDAAYCDISHVATCFPVCTAVVLHPVTVDYRQNWYQIALMHVIRQAA